MKVNFYIVRHGETLFNVKNRIQGVCDSPLTKKGIEQAKLAAKALESVYFHQSFTSPSERCINTAAYILKDRYIKPVILSDLREMDFGDFEGSRFTSHVDEIRYCFDHFDFSNVHGESRQQVSERAERVFKNMVNRAKDQQNILVVTHGFFEYFIAGVLGGINVEQYEEECRMKGKNPIPNAGIAKLVYEDGVFTLEDMPIEPENYVPRSENKYVSFYYVRHGQTKFNMYNRMQGFSDSPLTNMGKNQARMSHDALEHIPFTHAYVSTSQRTRDTADIVLSGKDTPITYTHGLKEVNFGEYEGVVTDSWRDEVMQRHIEGERWDDVGGDTAETVKQRQLSTIHKIVSAAKDGDTILLVSHGTYYLNLLDNVFGLDRETVTQKVRSEGKQLMPNGGIFRFAYDNGKFECISLMTAPEDFDKD